MGRRSKRDIQSRQRMLESVPHLNPEVKWEQLDSGELMAVYTCYDGGVRKWLRRLFPRPEKAQVMLDDIGTRVVRSIDGRRRVRDLIAQMEDELQISRKESEMSVVTFLEMLAKRRLVGFAVPQEHKKGELG